MMPTIPAAETPDSRTRVRDHSTSTIATTGHAGEAVGLRRAIFGALVAASIVAMLALFARVLSPGGYGLADIALIVCFGLTLPWMVVGFWNAAIGFILGRFSANPLRAVFPSAAAAQSESPIVESTAILLCIRNEVTPRLVRNLAAMMADLAATPDAHRFHIYVLSDSNAPAIIDAEATAFAAMAEQWRGRIALTYRLRADNAGYKAGNIGDFCARWGNDHTFALVLDADSFMSAAAILRLVRIAQSDPRIGILQSLVVGLPSTSAFTRIFQFGMRLGMRSYTLGSAWWQADCGPYWGHNALLRLKPFTRYAQLPTPQKPEDQILSHDQIEAVLMRGGGSHVRVIAEEFESWEENPPNLIEFLRRDLRWCRGNLQYWRFLAMPGLKPVSRCQLLFAMLMFLGSPGWIGLIVIGTLALALTDTPGDMLDMTAGFAMFVLVLAMWYAPKIATVADILSRKEARAAFGGTARFAASVATEVTVFMMLSSIMWFGHTLLILSLPFGRPLEWAGQMRDGQRIPLAQAIAAFWPHTLLGMGLLALLGATHPAALPYAIVLVGGLALSIPLAVLTANPRFGRFATRLGIGRLPEETTEPTALRPLVLPAIAAARSRAAE
ncbi:MAG: glucans biosynthesis glucosyltransferase MdoH [Xanthobacteraceae bacterium]